MVDRWVVNASPLIVLCKIGYESLLFDLADEIVVIHIVAHFVALKSFSKN